MKTYLIDGRDLHQELLERASTLDSGIVDEQDFALQAVEVVSGHLDLAVFQNNMAEAQAYPEFKLRAREICDWFVQRMGAEVAFIWKMELRPGFIAFDQWLPNGDIAVVFHPA